MILDEIVTYKKRELETIKEKCPIKDLELMLSNNTYESRDFFRAIANPQGISIIGEIKKASPSKGIIKEDFDQVSIAIEYEESNIDAISVLTETKFFMGSNIYLTQVREITSVPILRKDFIIDPYQIIEAKVIGADCILLIVSILDKRTLEIFTEIATGLGLDILVEVHNIKELEIALECGAKIIGINNRDLKTFITDIRTTEEIMKYITKDKVIVSESGIYNREDMLYLKELGVDGVLVGESLMRSESIAQKLQELRV